MWMLECTLVCVSALVFIKLFSKCTNYICNIALYSPSLVYYIPQCNALDLSEQLFVEWIIWMQYQLRFLASLSWLIICLNYKNKWFNSVFIYLKACLFWLSFFSKSTNNSSASQLQSDITTCVSLSWFSPWFRPMTLKIVSVWFTNWFSWFTKKNHTNNCTSHCKKYVHFIL